MTSGNRKLISATWDKIKIWSSGDNEDTQKAAVEANDRSCRIDNCTMF